MRDLAAGVGLCLLAIAGMVALMALQFAAPATDPDCLQYHQQAFLNFSFSPDLAHGAPKLGWGVVNLCDRWRPMPASPPDYSP